MEQDNLSDAEIAKLLKLAESDKSTKKKKKKNGVDRYIAQHSIKSGSSKIPTYFIYYHYAHNKKKKDRISRLWFFRRFSDYFEPTTFNGERSYYLDPEPFDLSPESKFKARAFLRKERSVKKEKV